MHRVTLDNGLRVVLSPLAVAPVIGLSVHYDVGFRSEPSGRTGFAHLFEHLMFQGSEDVGKLEHFRHVQAAGGSANGSTHPDYTDYHQVVPASALERVLFLEASRMRAPRFSVEDLRTQVDVVKEEIRLNVTNRPYGGFPWTVLPAVLYRSFANAHNGYGDFADLERATVQECRAFFDAYYAPNNAVLALAGWFDPAHAMRLVERYFADIPARSLPAPPVLSEPRRDREARGAHHDRHAPLPALAVGYRLPDPTTELPDYLAHMALSSILTGGHNARLQRHLMRGSGMVTDVRTRCGLFGPLRARDPDTFVLVATHPTGTRPDDLLAVVDRELADVAEHGPTEVELTQAVARSSADVHRSHDSLLTRACRLATFELLHGAAELVDELSVRFAAVDAQRVARAARSLRSAARGVLTLVPGGAR